MNKKSRKPTVGEAVVELLADYGVELVFGIPGTHSIELYRGLGAAGVTTKIRHISPRHEQGGGFMADGYARISGKPGVCFVITGPGVTNMTTPLGEAYMDAVPMLVISPVNEPDPDNYNRGRLHEITNQSAVTAPLTAFSATVGTPDEIPQLLARAFALFASERPQPVHISIPLSILSMPVAEKWRAAAPSSLPSPPLAGDEQIARAVQMIQRAKRPVVIAGGGTIRCAAAIITLGETIPCPLLTTIAGRGVAPASHPLSVGAQVRAPRVQALFEDTDLAVFLGTEFAQTDLWNDNLKLPQQQIWVNLNPGALQRDGEVLAIHAEAGDTATRIAEQLPPAKKARRDAVHMLCAAARDAHRRDLTPKEKAHWAVLAELMKHLPEETTIVSDMTQIAYTATDYLPLERPNSWLHPTGYGTLGYALPAAIGAVLADRSRPALVLVGDAGLQYTMQEMTLAAELELNLVVLLWNNDALQQIHDDMDAAGIRPLGVCQQNPDFIAVARACGWRAHIVESLSAFGADLHNAFARAGPVLLRVDQDSIPPALE